MTILKGTIQRLSDAGQADFGNTDGLTPVSAEIQAVIDAYGGVFLERGKTYILDAALTPKSGEDFFFVDAYGVGPAPILKHNGTVYAIDVDRSSGATSAFAVSSLSAVTVNNNYLQNITLSSLDATMTARKYGVVYSNDPFLGEDTVLIATISKTTATTITVTTARAHGLGSSGSVRFGYIQGMTQLSGQLCTFTRTNSTTIVCTTTDNTSWGAYTQYNGYLTASGSQSWMGEGFQIYQTGGTTQILTYGLFDNYTRYATTPFVRMLDNNFKVHIANIEIQANGDPYDVTITGENNRCPAIRLRACVGGYLDNITYRRNWSTACRMESCMDFEIPTMYCYESPNLVNINGYGYGLLLYGTCFNIHVGLLRGSQLRHLITSGSQNSSSSWSSTTWYTKGTSRRITVDVLDHTDATGCPNDTHETGVDWHFGKCTIQYAATATQSVNSITNITKAATAVATYSGANNFSNDQQFTFANVGGMTQINGTLYFIKNLNTSLKTFEIYTGSSASSAVPLDTSGGGFSAYTSGGSMYVYVNPNGGGMSIRGRSVTIDNLTIIGAYVGVAINTTEHGAQDEYKFGNVTIISSGSATGGTGDNDVGFQAQSARGYKYAPRITIQNLTVNGYSKAVKHEEDCDVTITDFVTQSCDVVADVFSNTGTGLKVIGGQQYDFRVNQWNSPSHYCYLMRSDSVGGSVVTLMQRPEIIRGNTVDKPANLFYAFDTTNTKYYWVPDTGLVQTNSVAQRITGVTKANPAVVSYYGDDSISNGQTIKITGVLGMTQLNGNTYTVANLNAANNTFELSGVDSSAYGTYTSGGTFFTQVTDMVLVGGSSAPATATLTRNTFMNTNIAQYTKGDINVGNSTTSQTALTVGANGRILQAQSNDTLGVGWYDVLMRPNIQTTRWLTPISLGSFNTTNTLTLNTVVATPIFVKRRTTFDQIGFATNVVTGISYKLGIYTDNGGVPDALVSGSTVTAGPFTTAALTQQATAFAADLTLDAGWYWVAMMSDTSGGSIAWINSVSMQFMIGSRDLTTASSDRVSTTATYASGLPSSFGAPTYSAGSTAPQIGLRVK